MDWAEDKPTQAQAAIAASFNPYKCGPDRKRKVIPLMMSPHTEIGLNVFQDRTAGALSKCPRTYRGGDLEPVRKKATRKQQSQIGLFVFLF
jgi:hypothetical protein